MPSHTHFDGEVVPHVLPDAAFLHVDTAPASFPRCVSVKVPPDSIDHTDEPKSCEQEANEDPSADQGCGANKVANGQREERKKGKCLDHMIPAVNQPSAQSRP